MFRQRLMAHSLGEINFQSKRLPARLTDCFALDYNNRYDFADSLTGNEIRRALTQQSQNTSEQRH